MPVFEIQTPDGKTYEVEAPDAQTASRPFDSGTSWGQVGQGYQQNFAGNAAKFGKDTLNAIMDPIGTAKGMIDLGVGGVQHAGTALGLREGTTPQMEVASNFAQGLKEDYGNTERFKRSLQQKPFETTMDLLLPFSVMRAPWSISKGERLARRTPSVEANEAKARGFYDAADSSGAKWTPQEYNSITGKAGAVLQGHKGSAKLTPKSVGLLQEMAKWRNTQQGIKDLIIYRRHAQAAQKEATRAGNDVDAKVAKEVKKLLDAEIEKKSPEYTEGNKHWARARERERVENLINAGEVDAQGQTGALGAEANIRKHFKNVVKPTEERGAHKLRKYSEPVQKQIIATSEGTPLSNAMRRIGKMAPTGPVPQGSGLVASILGDMAVPGVGKELGPTMWATGGLARAIANKGTRSRAHKAAALAGSGGKLPIDVNVENQARLATVLQQIEENKARNRGQY
jgi:hypothetical protein